MLLRKTISAAIILVSSVPAYSLDVISQEQILAIRACVETRLAKTVRDNTFIWRSRGRYIAGSNNGFTVGYSIFSACGLRNEHFTGDWGGAEVRDIFPAPADGGILEGQQLKGGTYSQLPDCERYIFEGPVTVYNEGTHKHDVSGKVGGDPRYLSCSMHTAGAHKIGGGGGHVYGACAAKVKPELNDLDREGFYQLCAKEVLE